MFKKLFNSIRKKVTAKQLVVTGAFVLAMGGAVGAGLIAKQNMTASAASGRDCSTNSIDYVDMNGGCGALSPAEWIADLRANQPGDLQSSAAAFGLPVSQYDQFARTAMQGNSFKDGTVWVDNQIVMTNSWSIGRHNKAKAWVDHGYYANFAQDVYRGNSIPVMVMFNAQGVAQITVMNPCGNLVFGNQVIPQYHCDALNMTPVSGKKDTYSFTTNVTATGNAVLGGITYDFGDGTNATSTNPAAPIVHTYTKPGNYTARVYAAVGLPGRQSVTFTGVQCSKPVTVLAPTYVCTGLVAKALDEEMQNFRFTTKMAYANGPTPTSADFTVDGSKTTNSVNKDTDGNYYYDATFTDTAQHTISAKINFSLDGATVTTKEDCISKVTSKHKPMCTVPGKEQYPPEAPECHECKPGIPMGDTRCAPKVLPNTGMGNVAGLFAGTSAFGAVGHRLFTRRKNR